MNKEQLYLLTRNCIHLQPASSARSMAAICVRVSVA